MPPIHTISYNGYALQHVTIDRYDSEPVFADDGVSFVTVKHVLSGTALISAATAPLFKTEYDSANTKLMVPRGTLVIDFDDAAGGVAAVSIGGITGPDDLDGPKAKFSINQMIGVRAAVISFEIEWNKYDPASGSVQDVLSHAWRTSFSYDETGRATYNVAGTLVVNRNGGATTTGDISNPIGNADIFVGNNADAYRLAVTAPIPGGFRRDRSEYAVDESGSRLIYTLSYKEVARDLPSPAKVGSGSFSWSSSIHGDGLVGRKTLDIELEGRVDANVADLLAAAVAVSKNRIRWGPGQAEGGGVSNGIDIIESIRVEERDIFDSVKIGLRITAISPRDVEAIGIPNVTLLSNIVGGITDLYTDVSPYGAAAIMSIRRTLRDSTYTDIDHAEIEALAEGEKLLLPSGYFTGTDAIYQFPDRVFDPLVLDIVPGYNASTTSLQPSHSDFAYTNVSLSERIETLDTGMIALSPRSSFGDAIRYQVRQPVVVLVSDCVASRVGLPPDRQFLRRPPRTMLLTDKQVATGTRVDGNGNVVFTAHFRRVAQLPRKVADSNFSIDGSNGIISFWPNGNKIRTPFDARVDPSSATEDDVLTAGQAGRSIGVGDREDYLT